jgi:hypothetical protein
MADEIAGLSSKIVCHALARISWRGGSLRGEKGVLEDCERDARAYLLDRRNRPGARGLSRDRAFSI